MSRSTASTTTAPHPVETLTSRGKTTRYGTFYRYFEPKEDIFRELSTQLFQDMASHEPAEAGEDAAAKMIASNQALSRSLPRRT